MSRESRPTWRPALIMLFRTSLIRSQPGSHEKLLADATHRCRASIRTLNGPLLGPVHFGVRSKSQVHHHRAGPGDCWWLPSNLRSCVDHALIRSYPNKAVDVVAYRTFSIAIGFLQRMSAPWSCLLQQSLRLVLSDWCVDLSLLGSRLLLGR